MTVTRRRAVKVGAGLVYAAPLVAASFKVNSAAAQAFVSPAPTNDTPCTHGFWKNNLKKCKGDKWPSSIKPTTYFPDPDSKVKTFGAAISAEPNCTVFQGAAALLNVAAGIVPETKSQVEALIKARDCNALTAINENGGGCPFPNSCKTTSASGGSKKRRTRR